MCDGATTGQVLSGKLRNANHCVLTHTYTPQESPFSFSLTPKEIMRLVFFCPRLGNVTVSSKEES